MSTNPENEPAGGPGWGEPMGWLGALMAAVMPTAVLVSIVRTFDGAPWPVFAPLLYIGVFTVLVLIIKPWSLR